MRRLLIALLMAVASAAGFAAEVLVTMRSGVDNSLLEQREVETAVEMRTVSAPSVAGKIFVGWTSSSEQAFVSRDRHGRAMEVARQVIYGETTLTANYLNESVDTDADGVPDGWERYWYGDLDETATSDTDGDGYDFAAELAAGTDPLMPFRASHGLTRERIFSSIGVQPMGRRLGSCDGSRHRRGRSSLRFLWEGRALSRPTRRSALPCVI